MLRIEFAHSPAKATDGPGAREMAKQCEICGKSTVSGHSISHAHNVSNRRWNVNLRPVKAKTPKGNKKIRVCTSCIRSGKVTKA